MNIFFSRKYFGGYFRSERFDCVFCAHIGAGASLLFEAKKGRKAPLGAAFADFDRLSFYFSSFSTQISKKVFRPRRGGGRTLTRRASARGGPAPIRRLAGSAEAEEKSEKGKKMARSRRSVPSGIAARTFGLRS
jgi:hypothetical protein